MGKAHASRHKSLIFKFRRPISGRVFPCSLGGRHSTLPFSAKVKLQIDQQCRDPLLLQFLVILTTEVNVGDPRCLSLFVLGSTFGLGLKAVPDHISTCIRPSADTAMSPDDGSLGEGEEWPVTEPSASTTSALEPAIFQQQLGGTHFWGCLEGSNRRPIFVGLLSVCSFGCQ